MQKLQLLTYLEHGALRKFKSQPAQDNSDNVLHLHDIGLGLLWSKKDSWWIRADYAWRLGPYAFEPKSDSSHTNGHFWIQGGIYF